MPRLPSRFADGPAARLARAALLAGAAVALAAFALGCPPASTLPAGCSKDVDCKGARICVVHACVDPPPPKPKTIDLGAADGGVISDGGATDLLAAVGDGGVAAPPPLGASPTFHGDAQHTGRSRFRAPTNVPSEVAHVATGGVVFGSPAITDDGVVIFGSHDKSIYAVDSTGKILWRHATNDLVWSSPTIGPGGVVYVGSDDDHLYALDLKDGSVRWTFQAGPCRVNTGVGPENARCDVDGVSVAADGTVYAAADGLYALSPEGKLAWKFSPGVTHCAAPPAIGLDGTVYIGCHDDALYAIAPDGKKKWDFRAGDDIDSSPVVSPEGIVYVGSDDHKLYALAPGGNIRWAVTTGGPVRSSPALAADGTVYVGSFDGSLYAVKAGGVVAWSFRSADRIASSPLVDAAGNVLIGSEDDRLYELAPDGKLMWSVLLDGDVDSTPALAADGTIWVGCDDRALHALH
ncbi:MAG TPA: PQQ-binding-like beta-propeller repeat protein [Polyangia bacterium]|nr:PQQ-binding-like beta-propeller repeat protein [Polyangia bacterium]